MIKVASRFTTAVEGHYPEAEGVVIDAPETAKALLIAGQPLKEPIAQYGPFVMNTESEIDQALNDFREGRFV